MENKIKHNGYYLVYYCCGQAFGYCGGDIEKTPPFNEKGHAILFKSRKEARHALKHYRSARGITKLTHNNARKFGIIHSNSARINNK